MDTAAATERERVGEREREGERGSERSIERERGGEMKRENMWGVRAGEADGLMILIRHLLK